MFCDLFVFLHSQGRTAALSERAVGARSREVLSSWSDLAPLGLELHVADEGSCAHALRLGVAEAEAPGMRSAARHAGI